MDRRFAVARGRKPEQLAVKFWRHVEFGHDCWHWTGKKHKGYGATSHGGSNRITSNRLAWMVLRGPIPAGMHVLHHCDNPGCVNLSHLFLGTHSDNMMDRNKKGRCAKGERHGLAVLTDQVVREIEAAKQSGVAPRECASAMGLKESTVRNVYAGTRWAHITQGD